MLVSSFSSFTCVIQAKIMFFIRCLTVEEDLEIANGGSASAFFRFSQAAILASSLCNLQSIHTKENINGWPRRSRCKRLTFDYFDKVMAGSEMSQEEEEEAEASDLLKFIISLRKFSFSCLFFSLFIQCSYLRLMLFCNDREEKVESMKKMRWIYFPSFCFLLCMIYDMSCNDIWGRLIRLQCLIKL